MVESLADSSETMTSVISPTKRRPIVHRIFPIIQTLTSTKFQRVILLWKLKSSLDCYISSFQRNNINHTATSIGFEGIILFFKSKSPQKLPIRFVFFYVMSISQDQTRFLKLLEYFNNLQISSHHAMFSSSGNVCVWSLEPTVELNHIITRILHIEAMHVDIIVWFKM